MILYLVAENEQTLNGMYFIFVYVLILAIGNKYSLADKCMILR